MSGFQTLLCGKGITLTDRNAANKTLQGNLSSVKQGTVLNIANSLWCDDQFPLSAAYQKAIQTYYSAKVSTLDLQSDGAKNVINQWVSDSTGGYITKQIDFIPKEATLYLFNTVYLNAPWATPFTENGSVSAFTCTGGKQIKAEYMNKYWQSGSYIETNGCTGILLPYQDEHLAYLCLLPKEGTTAGRFVSSLTGNSIADFVKSAQTRDIKLRIPRYQASCKVDMNEVLKKMGITAAFKPGKANFAKMSGDGKKNPGITLSEAEQNVNLAIDEKGTIAASSTMFGLYYSKGKEQVPLVEITFNRPFVYAVVDLRTNLPLFLGVTDRPAEYKTRS